MRFFIFDLIVTILQEVPPLFSTVPTIAYFFWSISWPMIPPNHLLYPSLFRTSTRSNSNRLQISVSPRYPILDSFTFPSRAKTVFDPLSFYKIDRHRNSWYISDLFLLLNVSIPVPCQYIPGRRRRFSVLWSRTRHRFLSPYLTYLR